MQQYLRLEEIKLALADDESLLENKILKILNCKKEDIISYTVVKKSIDSRDKHAILFIYSIDIDLKQKSINLTKPNLLKHKAKYVEQFLYEIPEVPPNPMRKRPIIVGTGPAGLFAGLALARAGLNPVIIERGKAVEGRLVDVGMFMKGDSLDIESNIQFGEGGAGTFSDGKLYTMINDPRSKYVFEEMVAAGAPEEIMYKAKAHVGTDKLRILVRELRKKIISLGADIRFSTCMTDIEIVEGRLVAIIVNGGERIECDTLILAIGHSARDTYEMICAKGLDIVQKPFSMGVRIEHDANMINRSQFGDACVSPKLGTASYKLVTHGTDTRTVYSFCMCPGGHVVAASSENGRLCINGMSEYRQNSGISNSALMVPVTPADFGSDHPLAGIEFQRKWEEKAFILGGSDYRAPAQLVGDFLADRPSTQDNDIKTTYLPGVKMTSIKECLPEFITAALRVGLRDLDHKIKGFADPKALLIAIEARSSAVIRITRDKETLQSNILGIYPSGEGAGYAGGITSSAIDGLIVSERIIAEYLK
ncbi:FAD-dependent oxidoreductase [Candidatus Gracilibacteria bacterium]|nr:FAD-dependent oxidoreductase [Candidatus Gracilibacteria bacterium]